MWIEQICRSNWHLRGASQDKKSSFWNDVEGIHTHMQAAVRNLQHPRRLLPEEGGHQQCSGLAQKEWRVVREQRTRTGHDIQQHGLLLQTYWQDANCTQLPATRTDHRVKVAEAWDPGGHSPQHLCCVVLAKQARARPQSRHECRYPLARNDARKEAWPTSVLRWRRGTAPWNIKR